MRGGMGGVKGGGGGGGGAEAAPPKLSAEQRAAPGAARSPAGTAGPHRPQSDRGGGSAGPPGAQPPPSPLPSPPTPRRNWGRAGEGEGGREGGAAPYLSLCSSARRSLGTLRRCDSRRFSPSTVSSGGTATSYRAPVVVWMQRWTGRSAGRGSQGAAPRLQLRAPGCGSMRPEGGAIGRSVRDKERRTRGAANRAVRVCVCVCVCMRGGEPSGGRVPTGE